MPLLIITHYDNTENNSLDFQNRQIPALFSAVKAVETFITMKIIIQLIIRESKFNTVMPITRHSTANGNWLKKCEKNGRCTHSRGFCNNEISFHL